MMFDQSTVLTAVLTADEIISREERKLQCMNIYEPFERRERKRINKFNKNVNIPISKDKTNTSLLSGSCPILTSQGLASFTSSANKPSCVEEKENYDKSPTRKTQDKCRVFNGSLSDTDSANSSCQRAGGSLTKVSKDVDESVEAMSAQNEEMKKLKGLEDSVRNGNVKDLENDNKTTSRHAKDNVQNEEFSKVTKDNNFKQNSILRLKNDTNSNFPDNLKYKRLVKLFHNSLNNTHAHDVRTQDNKKSSSLHLGREVKPLPTVTLPILRRGEFHDNPSIVLIPSVRYLDTYASPGSFLQRSSEFDNSNDKGDKYDSADDAEKMTSEAGKNGECGQRVKTLERRMTLNVGDETEQRSRSMECMVRRPGPLLPILAGIKRHQPDNNWTENYSAKGDPVHDGVGKEKTLPSLDPLEVKGEKCVDTPAIKEAPVVVEKLPRGEKKRVRIKDSDTDNKDRETDDSQRGLIPPERNLAMKRQLSKIGCGLPPLLNGAHRRNKHIRIQDNTNFIKTKLETEAKDISTKTRRLRVPIYYSLLDHKAFVQHKMCTFVTW